MARPDQVGRHLGNDDCARLHVDLFMLHTHHQDPVQAVTRDRCLDRMLVEQSQNELPNFLSITSDGLKKVDLLVKREG